MGAKVHVVTPLPSLFDIVSIAKVLKGLNALSRLLDQVRHVPKIIHLHGTVHGPRVHAYPKNVTRVSQDVSLIN